MIHRGEWDSIEGATQGKAEVEAFMRLRVHTAEPCNKKSHLSWRNLLFLQWTKSCMGSEVPLTSILKTEGLDAGMIGSTRTLYSASGLSQFS